jgi:transcriptional regulator with XRE-family HTH domain
MLTEFGQFLRKLRIDRGKLLKDMADTLGVSASYLSAVETGKRNIPSGWVAKIAEDYSLDLFEQEGLTRAAQNSVREVNLDLTKMSQPKKETALLFARQFERIDNSALEEIRKLLKR